MGILVLLVNTNNIGNNDQKIPSITDLISIEIETSHNPIDQMNQIEDTMRNTSIDIEIGHINQINSLVDDNNRNLLCTGKTQIEIDGTNDAGKLQEKIEIADAA